MDHRTREGPRHWSCFHFFVLVCMCLAKVHIQHVAAADAFSPLILDNQGASEDSSDSRNKLDSLSHLLPYTSEQDIDYKRSSSFFPLRGKKMTIDPEFASRYGIGSELDEKRSQFYPLRGKKIPDELKRASYFMPMRGRKDDAESWMEDGPEDSLEKRMSSFMPMRGKKQNGFQHLGKSGTYSTDIYPSSGDSNSSPPDKREMSAFLPTRGKRSVEQDIENKTAVENGFHTHQRRSVGFMPMRGRRMSSEESATFDQGAIATSLLEKKQSSFMPMRGRRYQEKNDNTPPINQSDGGVDNDYNKRASSFMPMRGRKSSLEDDINVYEHAGIYPGLQDYDLDEIKRGRQSFNAMRGRRSLAGEYPNAGDAFEDISNRDMRASSFMPMRGRRSEDMLNLLTANEKRSAFIPMRGRRMAEETLKDEPMKKFQFVPMRGRSASTENSTANDDDFLDAESKRGSSFMPMRGRRFVSDGYSNYVYSPLPYLVSSGIGSSLMTRHFGSRLYPISSVRSAGSKYRKFDWDSVKRAFHATRGKRLDAPENDAEDLVNKVKSELGLKVTEDIRNEKNEGCRCKRSIMRPFVSLKPQKQYIALKRPMSFFATRGKRLDDSALDSVSKLR